MTSVTSSFVNFEVHRLSGGFTQRGFPILYGPQISFRLDGHMPSVLFIRTLKRWIALAAALEIDTSSFGVVLYLCTASATVHCFLAAILWILRWHLSTMPLPLGTCAHLNLELGSPFDLETLESKLFNALNTRGKYFASILWKQNHSKLS